MQNTKKIIGATTTMVVSASVVAGAMILVGSARSSRNRPVGTGIVAQAIVKSAPASADPPAKDFAITSQVRDGAGNAALLFPGVQRTLRLTIGNPNNQAIAVNSLNVNVKNATGPRIPSQGQCLASRLIVGQFSGSLTVPANGSTTYDVPIRLDSSATDACQGATFPLTFSGSAVKA